MWCQAVLQPFRAVCNLIFSDVRLPTIGGNTAEFPCESLKPLMAFLPPVDASRIWSAANTQANTRHSPQFLRTDYNLLHLAEKFWSLFQSNLVLNLALFQFLHHVAGTALSTTASVFRVETVKPFISQLVVLLFLSMIKEMQHCIILFMTVNAVRASSGFSADPQEFKSVHAKSGMCKTCLQLPPASMSWESQLIHAGGYSK